MSLKTKEVNTLFNCVFFYPPPLFFFNHSPKSIISFMAIYETKLSTKIKPIDIIVIISLEFLNK